VCRSFLLERKNAESAEERVVLGVVCDLCACAGVFLVELLDLNAPRISRGALFLSEPQLPRIRRIV